MAKEPYVVVGRVVKTHGLKGEVSVAAVAETSFELLKGVEVWFVPPPRRLQSARVVAARHVHKGMLVTFEGVSSIDLSSSLTGCELLVRTDSLPDDWEHPISEDRAGFRVVDSVHGELGTIVETIVTGANDVWVVHGALGEVLIPVIDQVVGDVDTVRRTVHVTLLPGLLGGDEA